MCAGAAQQGVLRGDIGIGQGDIGLEGVAADDGRGPPARILVEHELGALQLAEITSSQARQSRTLISAMKAPTHAPSTTSPSALPSTGLSSR